MKTIFCLLPGLVAIAAVCPVSAADADMAKIRLAGFKAGARAMKTIMDELKSDTPQISLILPAALQIRDTASQQFHWFPKGSGPESDPSTKAKPEIWSQPAQFKMAQDNFKAGAEGMMRAAQSGDLNQIRAAVRPLGQACGGCHHEFRANP